MLEKPASSRLFYFVTILTSIFVTITLIINSKEVLHSLKNK